MSLELMLGLLLILVALMGAPLFALIGGAAILGFYAIDYDLALVAVEFYRLADMPGLAAIPLFTLAGYLLGASQAPKRLVRLSDGSVVLPTGRSSMDYRLTRWRADGKAESATSPAERQKPRSAGPAWCPEVWPGNQLPWTATFRCRV